MKIIVLKENLAGEARVSATPDSVKKLCALGADVCVVNGAGESSGISDSHYESAGAKIAGDIDEAAKNADIILCVNSPEMSTINKLPDSCSVVGMLSPYNNKSLLSAYAKKSINAYALELLPRISRAQGMDVLSSQSNLAGYRAVIEAIATFGKVVPMMMTAAGTVVPAKALVLGAGVAGLQAIATAKRLGAVVSAFDVRPVVKEQVQSLGAKFIEVAPDAGETSTGYAKEMSEDYKLKQRALIHEVIAKQDMVISTALIPGKQAPELITEEMLKSMKTGSVIVDMAAASGGNCRLTEVDKTIVKHGVTLVGLSNFPSLVAVDASTLYAKNIFNFVSTLLINKSGEFAPSYDDELVKGTLLTRGGEIIHELFKEQK